MISTIIRWILAIGLTALAGPLCWELLAITAAGLHWPPPDAPAILCGTILGILFFFWRKPNLFLLTLEHELCHVVACLLVLVRPTGFKVTFRSGGSIEHVQTDPIRTAIIQIAPYTMPLLLTGPAIARQFYFTNPGPWRQVLGGACALLFILHIQGVLHNIGNNLSRTGESDLYKVGWPLAFALILLAMMLISWWILKVLWATG